MMKPDCLAARPATPHYSVRLTGALITTPTHLTRAYQHDEEAHCNVRSLRHIPKNVGLVLRTEMIADDPETRKNPRAVEERQLLASHDKKDCPRSACRRFLVAECEKKSA